MSAVSCPLVPAPSSITGMLRALPPAPSRRSRTTTSKPRSISSCAALMPATPPPNKMTRVGMGCLVIIGKLVGLSVLTRTATAKRGYGYVYCLVRPTGRRWRQWQRDLRVRVDRKVTGHNGLSKHYLRSPEEISARDNNASVIVGVLLRQWWSGQVKPDNRVGLLDAERDFFAHTEKEFRLGSDLQELERHVRCDNELHRRAAERHHHAGVAVQAWTNGAANRRPETG